MIAAYHIDIRTPSFYDAAFKFSPPHHYCDTHSPECMTISSAGGAGISDTQIHKSVFATCSQIAAGLFTLRTAAARSIAQGESGKRGQNNAITQKSYEDSHVSSQGEVHIGRVALPFWRQSRSISDHW